uniref:ORF2 n=1 Tax=Torque teno Leptonychotes weddellii virus-1 TaxID=2012676 RepID=A0A1Z2RVJ4_9VIRU|nr:ORF2 [Torque teno Leptonychotes weddellii virus 1]
MSAAASSPGYPDFHHPLQFRRQEALWKQYCSLKHREFCACPNFLDHFKWSTGERGGGDREDQDGGATGGEDIGGDTPIGITGGEGDISDAELLQ